MRTVSVYFEAKWREQKSLQSFHGAGRGSYNIFQNGVVVQLKIGDVQQLSGGDLEQLSRENVEQLSNGDGAAH
jgi:hypothetical protein